MTVLYEDQYIVCDDNGVRIYWYYFPIGSKPIPYATIRSVQEESIGFWTGARRLTGHGLESALVSLRLEASLKNKVHYYR